MPFYIFAWIASLTYGFYAVTTKLIGKYQLKNVAQFSFFSLLFSGLVITVISLINGAGVAISWTFIILAAIFLALGNTLYIAALKNLDVSVMAPLFNIRVVITVFLGCVFLGETLTVNNMLLVGFIVFAGFFATMDEKFSIKSFFAKNVAVGLLFMLVLSIRSVFINRAIAQTDYWTASMWINLLAIVPAFIFLYPRFRKDLSKSKPADYLGVVILSFLGGLGDLAANKAFEGNVGISSVIISLPISMVLAFVFAIWKPNWLEKHPLKVYVIRFTAAAVMIWGALQLSS
ncbi:EamA family transporter [Patescibacteria group bacterium]|nr:EamA family transporter [Patescibacteria group bacterium]MBU1931908.1 EamA family transporter [Patescibacteria group bacterium]